MTAFRNSTPTTEESFRHGEHIWQELSDYAEWVRDCAAAGQSPVDIQSLTETITEFIEHAPRNPDALIKRALLVAIENGDQQSIWEADLARASRMFYRLRRMPSGGIATEKAIAGALNDATMMCQTFAQYCVRNKRRQQAITNDSGGDRSEADAAS